MEVASDINMHTITLLVRVYVQLGVFCVGLILMHFSMTLRCRVYLHFKALNWNVEIMSLHMIMVKFLWDKMQQLAQQ